MSPAAAAREVAQNLASNANTVALTNYERANTMRIIEGALLEFANILRSDRCSDDAGCLCGCKLPEEKRGI